MSRHKFGQSDDHRKGPLKYTVKKQRANDWSIGRNSKRTDDTGSADLFQKGYGSEDEAKQVLWDIKERNVVRIAATENKLAIEQREQAALLESIGTWLPPEPPTEANP